MKIFVVDWVIQFLFAAKPWSLYTSKNVEMGCVSPRPWKPWISGIFAVNVSLAASGKRDCKESMFRFRVQFSDKRIETNWRQDAHCGIRRWWMAGFISKSNSNAFKQQCKKFGTLQKYFCRFCENTSRTCNFSHVVNMPGMRTLSSRSSSLMAKHHLHHLDPFIRPQSVAWWPSLSWACTSCFHHACCYCQQRTSWLHRVMLVLQLGQEIMPTNSEWKPVYHHQHHFTPGQGALFNQTANQALMASRGLSKFHHSNSGSLIRSIDKMLRPHLTWLVGVTLCNSMKLRAPSIIRSSAISKLPLPTL